MSNAAANITKFNRADALKYYQINHSAAVDSLK